MIHICGFIRTARCLANTVSLAPFSLLYLAFCFPWSLSASILLCSYIFNRAPSSSALTFSSYGRISTEHSPKLQIRSHSYLRAVSEVSINRSLDSLDPAGLLASPKFRSRNESYMRAMSTISQVSGTQGPVPHCLRPLHPLYLNCYVQQGCAGGRTSHRSRL